MEITLTKLREDIYRVLDEVLETGVPLTVLRKGKKIIISAEQQPARLAKFKRKKKVYSGEIVDLGWENEWKARE